MRLNRLVVLLVCLGLLFTLASTSLAQERTPNKNDVKGLNPKHNRYVLSVLGGAAAGAGLGFLLGGGLKTAKLATIGGGAMSTWYLYGHRTTFGSYHNMAMIGSNAVLGTGIGWTICDCGNGAAAGALGGGGATAIWQVVKHDKKTSWNQMPPPPPTIQPDDQTQDSKKQDDKKDDKKQTDQPATGATASVGQGKNPQ
ncbi:MAG TPA: hypothetical protein VKZ53_26725 [Candidatus Angelobacter sp.]|nr:hypothetical protein [Candidatus Angelobacter sp.]